LVPLELDLTCTRYVVEDVVLGLSKAIFDKVPTVTMLVLVCTCDVFPIGVAPLEIVVIGPAAAAVCVPVPAAVTMNRLAAEVGRMAAVVKRVLAKVPVELAVADAVMPVAVCTTSHGFLIPGPKVWIKFGPVAYVPAVVSPVEFHSMYPSILNDFDVREEPAVL
jgi:hypothetical protein